MLFEIYSRLLSTFGYRNWWPAETRDEVIIGAILTQSVSWKNVKIALSNLRYHDILTIKDINRADKQTIASLIKSTRFYNQKAIKLKNFTDFLFREYEGDLDNLFDHDTISIREQLIRVKGLGEETVDSILLYAGGKKIFVIDAYTKRVFSRLGIIGENWTYSKIQTYFLNNLKSNTEIYGDYHAQIVNLGHLLCRKTNPSCNQCPLEDLCRYRSSY